MKQKPSLEKCLQVRNDARRSMPAFPPPVNGQQTLAEACHAVRSEHAHTTAAKVTNCRAQRKLYAQDILHDLMELHIKCAGFAVITTGAIRWMQNIIQDLPCLEVGAGHGLITHELMKLNVDAIATDPHFPDESRYGFRNPLSPITKLDAVSAVQQLPRPCLIWSWPETEPYTAEALNAFQGQHLIYVGEAEHGSTGSPQFHQILQQRFRVADTFAIPQYPHQHDRCQHFTRVR